jgi:hypothetical protein
MHYCSLPSLHDSSTPTFAANAAFASLSIYAAANTTCAAVPDWLALSIDATDSTVSAISAVITSTIATKIPHTSDTTAYRETSNVLAYGALSQV